MKRYFITLLLLFTVLGAQVAQAQMMNAKKFDYSILEDKTLYIPKWSENSNYAKKLIKKGKFDKLKSYQDRVKEHNRIWTEAMAQSSYDATPYEIRDFDAKKLVKDKKSNALFLGYFADNYGNWYAKITATSPKTRVIAIALINGIDLSDTKDVRLMMNMLNYSLNTAAEIVSEGDQASRKNVMNKYKENLVSFFEKMHNMTFLVPGEVNKKKPKKAAERNSDLKAALRDWKLSKYKFTNQAEVDKKRLEGDENSFYWRSFSYYTNNPLITYRFNYILTTERDEVVFVFLGSKRLKPKTLKEIENKIQKRAERFKAKLNK